MSTKKYNLDLFKLLREADKKNYNYFVNLPESHKQEFQPWVAMRFMSTGNNGYDALSSLLLSHYSLNKDFNITSKDKELFYRLMCTVGDGSVKKHYMQKPPSGKVDSPLIIEIMDEFIDESLDEDEMYLLLDKNEIGYEDLKSVAEDLQWDAAKIKELKKSYDNFIIKHAN